MPTEFQRNQRDAQEVIQYLEQAPETDETHGEIMIAVHPGFGLNNENYTSAEGLRREDYFRHTLELHRDIEKAVENNIPVDVVYRGKDGEEALDYLGEHAERIDNYIKSSTGSGFITSEQGKQGLAETVRKIEDGGEVALYGEMNGLCYSQFKDLMEEVEREAEKEFEIVDERPFPEDPLNRTEGVVHWKEDMPAYVKALEIQSTYR